MLGDAGHHGAIQAPKLGKKVAVVERSIDTSGDCPAFYPIRMRRSPDLGLKPGTQNQGSWFTQWLLRHISALFFGEHGGLFR